MWLFNIPMCIFCFFSNNVESYDSRSDLTTYDLAYLPRSYIGSWFWQPCSKTNTKEFTKTLEGLKYIEKTS